MKKTDAINFFGSSTAMAKALNIDVRATYQWSEKIPPQRQWELFVLSNMQLLPDAEILPANVNAELLTSGVEVKNSQVAKLLAAANSLADNKKSDALSALITLAETNLKKQ